MLENEHFYTIIMFALITKRIKENLKKKLKLSKIIYHLLIHFYFNNSNFLRKVDYIFIYLPHFVRVKVLIWQRGIFKCCKFVLNDIP